MPNWGCMDDCIHLHACRRVQAIGKKHRLLVPRYCTEDCDCYLSGNNLTGCVTISTAVRYATSGASSIREGYDEYDVYAPQDFENSELTLNDILKDFEDND